MINLLISNPAQYRIAAIEKLLNDNAKLGMIIMRNN